MTRYKSNRTSRNTSGHDSLQIEPKLNALSSNAVLRTFTWRLDASHTIGGAGGVGGLVRMEQGGLEYYPVYDPSHNVTGLMRKNADNTLDLVASYVLGPFGEVISTATFNGFTDTNPFRFSTKYTDSETGLVYFGYRYYNPKLGRFINRDPAGESGGVNLHGYVGNNPANRWDYLGMIEYAYNEVSSDFVLDPKYGSFDEFIGAIHPTWVNHGNNRWYDPDAGWGYEFGGSRQWDMSPSDSGMPSPLPAENPWAYIDRLDAEVASMVAFGQRVWDAIDEKRASRSGNKTDDPGEITANPPGEERKTRMDNGDKISVVKGRLTEAGKVKVDITLRINWRTQYGRPYDSQKTRAAWVQGIETMWSGVIGRYDVSTVVIDMTGKRGAAIDIEVRQFPNWGPYGAIREMWQPTTSPWTAAHEMSHWLVDGGHLSDGLNSPERTGWDKRIHYPNDGRDNIRWSSDAVGGTVDEQDIQLAIERWGGGG